MNDPSFKEQVRVLLESALACQPVPAGTHIVDDEDLLVLWSANRLTQAHREMIETHLANCSECREILRDLIESGTITLPSDPVPAPAVPAIAAADRTIHIANKAPHPQRTRLIRATSWIAAALVVMGVGISIWPVADPLDQQLTELEKRAAAPTLAVLKEATLLASHPARPEQTRRIREVIEQTAIGLSRRALQLKDYRTAVEVIDLAAAHRVESGRLTDLKLQAEQARLTGTMLAMNDRLDQDFGYNLRGRSAIKSIGATNSIDFSASQQELRKGYAAAIEKFPQQFELRINYARLLGSQKDWNASETQLLSALKLDPVSTEAIGLLGLSYFEQNKFELAREQFATAVKLAPKVESHQFNLGICLERLSRHEEALPIWRGLQQSTTDLRLRRSIEQLIR